MKPIKILFLILTFSTLFNDGVFSQNIKVNYSTQTINNYLEEKNKNIQDIQVVILQESNGKVEFSSGEALGIKQNNSTDIVIFILGKNIDIKNINYSLQNGQKLPLTSSSSIIDLQNSSTLDLYYSTANFSIKF